MESKHVLRVGDAAYQVTYAQPQVIETIAAPVQAPMTTSVIQAAPVITTQQVQTTPVMVEEI